ncbi:MAG: hypothetical protein J1E65_06170 [Lachnospiraceae bacterium]|nr:hypothetical protein [Lachnospiraceae bacterium]
MGNRISLKRIWQISRIEYYKWIINPRMIVAAAMIIFFWNFAVYPLMELSAAMNSPLNSLEPFLAVVNSKALNLITPAVYLFLISDYPRLDRNGLFSLQRVRKREWVIGQFLFFIYSAFSFLLVLFLFMLLPNAKNSFVADGWSLVVTQYGIFFPERAASFAATLITKELYNQIAPFEAAAVAFILNLFYLTLLAMILLLFYTFNAKKVGVTVAAGIIAFGSALGMIKSSGMWIFPMAHTMVSLHFTDYFRKPIMPLKTSFLYFVCAIVVLLVVSLLAIKHTNFLNIDDNGA